MADRRAANDIAPLTLREALLLSLALPGPRCAKR
jgi:hypothetical protein